jgi:hypothetical protein
MPVDASATTALATLLGAATGGLTSVLATWLTQRTQARAQWLEQDALRRQDLYKEFIKAAARCYVHALQHEETDIAALVDLYAKIDRMRILPRRRSSTPPNPSHGRSPTPTWNQTRASLSCGRW